VPLGVPKPQRPVEIAQLWRTSPLARLKRDQDHSAALGVLALLHNPPVADWLNAPNWRRVRGHLD
jgi:hypothetical protein